MLIKTNLVYLAEDYGITDYYDFSNYLFTNFREYVWRVYDGIEYCHANHAKFLAEEYLEYKSAVAEYYGLVNFVYQYRNACRDNPDAEIGVWR